MAAPQLVRHVHRQGEQVALLLLLLLPFLACGPSTAATAAETIGPHWAIEKLPRLPEAGPDPRNLVRVDGRRRVVVDELVRSYKFYEPDCVVYSTGRAGNDVFAVCGERTPIGIAPSGSWQFADDGLRRTRPAEVRDGRAVQLVELLPLSDIVALANRQPPFRAGWNGAFDGAHPPLQPVEQAAPIAANAIIEATKARRIALIDALLRSGADINARTDLGSTPLMIAASNGDIYLLDHLLAAGADVNAKDIRGTTALMAAADIGEKEIVKHLLAAGADPSLRDAEGHTAAQRIPQSEDQELLRLLGAQR